MKKFRLLLLVLLHVSSVSYTQHSYYYSHHDSLPPISLDAKTKELYYPINTYNVKAIGMGNVQMSLGKDFNAMMYNPAFLGRSKKSFEILTVAASMPPETYDAAWYLSDHLNEFLDATSLTQVYNGLEAFFNKSATAQQRLDALHRIQDGMQFTLDMAEKVTGPADEPYIHGISVVPAINAQYGNFGFSLFGFGYSGFSVHMSPTLDYIANIEIPDNLDQPLQAAKSLAQLLGALTTCLLGPTEGFANELFPIAYQVSYIDLVGALGYGFQWRDKWSFGANLKVVNRRFSTDRIPITDYDDIINVAMEVIKSDVIGMTGDIGCVYQSSWGTNFGLSLQNIFPVQTIKESIALNYRTPKIYYDRTPTGQLITNADGDTALVSAYRQITINRPFELKSPFIANIGFSHPISRDWDIALDWVDIFEQDSRYDASWERVQLGSEYRFNFWKNSFQFALRGGLADEKFCFGLGLNFSKYFQLDAAYAYDRFVNSYSYFSQIKIGF